MGGKKQGERKQPRRIKKRVQNDKSIIAKVMDLPKSTSDEEIHELFDKYKPLSIDVPRFKEDTPLGLVFLKTDSEKHAEHLIKKFNHKKFDGVEIKVNYDLTDESKKTLKVTKFDKNKTDDELKEFLHSRHIESFQRAIGKKGDIDGTTVVITLESIESATELCNDFDQNKIGGNDVRVLCNRVRNKCYICGEYGHLKTQCPMRVRTKREKRMEEQEKQDKEKEEEKEEKEPVGWSSIQIEKLGKMAKLENEKIKEENEKEGLTDDSYYEDDDLDEEEERKKIRDAIFHRNEKEKK
uniref:CCHC-type domain-containing protein n=1 Tax=Entamoeba invadens TaxID=33085 RepID=S0B4U1_ENTIV|nr:hypothetical protein [Entamoeba invadens]